MTTKDDLYALIDDLDEGDAREALEFLKARADLKSAVSPTYIADCEAAYVEAHAPGAVSLPHDAVRTWLEAWATPGESAADVEIEALEERLANRARDRATE
jgi:hypothetical protein